MVGVGEKVEQKQRDLLSNLPETQEHQEDRSVDKRMESTASYNLYSLASLRRTEKSLVNNWSSRMVGGECVPLLYVACN